MVQCIVQYVLKNEQTYKIEGKVGKSFNCFSSGIYVKVRIKQIIKTHPSTLKKRAAYQRARAKMICNNFIIKTNKYKMLLQPKWN